MDKNKGTILSRLWAKVHEILRHCRGPFVDFKAFWVVYIVFHFEVIRR